MAKAADIGSASLYLGLNSDGLTRGLRVAKSTITKGVTDLQSLLSTGLGAGIRGAGIGLAGIGAAGAAGLAGFTAATEVARERVQELSKVIKAGDAFGLSGSEGTGLFGLMANAGSDVRDASEGLVTLGARVRDALSGTGKEAAELFQGLNISAEKFQGLNPADQFYLLVDSLSKIQDPATRVGLLLKAVGEDTGKNLMPLLGKTGAEARAMAGQFSLSAEEISKMAGATNALSKLDTKFDRLKSKLAVSASPFLEAVASSLDRIDVDVVGRKFDRVYGIATDVFQRVSAYASSQFEKLSADLDVFLEKVVKPATKTTDSNGNPALSQFAKAVGDFGKSVGQFAGATADRLGAGIAAVGGVRDKVLQNLASFGGAVGFLDKDFAESLRLGFRKSAKMNFAESNDLINQDTGAKWGKIGETIGQKAGQALSEVAQKALTPPLRFAEAGIAAGLAAIEGAEKALKQIAAAPPPAPKGEYTANTAYMAGSKEELSLRLRAIDANKAGVAANAALAEAKRQSELQKELVKLAQQEAINNSTRVYLAQF